MTISIYKLGFDKVINSDFVIGASNYNYALQNLTPLIDKLEIQRKLQESAIYKRLKKDIISGCVMPPITVAFIDENRNFSSEAEAQNYIISNITNAFILDGIQRLNILKQISAQLEADLIENSVIALNILICPSMDKLLYRMVTLNNGQKPMTPAHQIEILTSSDLNFNELARKVRTEKEGYSKESLNKSDLVKAYIAFLSCSVNIDNQKIIQSKLDELITENIIEHFENKTNNLQFKDVVNLISSFSEDTELFEWFKINNNLIGFCVGIHESYDVISHEDRVSLLTNFNKLEEVFNSFDRSKIKVSTFRRNIVKNFISEYPTLRDKSTNQILDHLSSI
ncbi:hypothetical protein ACT4U9_02950 [Acinetobacter baumannii]|uniref:hypothetical protein n=1 Tax=Acinetobacter baumannii TaxID=470 RepID=UPI003756B5D4|nr:hypothetical protein [Acinetobacter baumannii]HCQ9890115.1 hypothetical protein [Acinetobacter baumannii]HCQ9892164.1 hypothetical protein [Acinetobacter baumannii]